MIVQLCRLIVNSSSSDSAELCKNGPSLNEWRGGDCGRELNTETGARVGCRWGHSDDELELSRMGFTKWSNNRQNIVVFLAHFK